MFPFSDELRYPPKCLWPTAHRSTVTGTTSKGLQRHGLAVVQFCKKLWLGGRHIRWDRVLHWRRALQAIWCALDTRLTTILVPGEKRPHKRYNCGVYHRRRPRCKGRSPGGCHWMRRLRSVQRCHRFIHAHGLKIPKGRSTEIGCVFCWGIRIARRFHSMINHLRYQRTGFHGWGGASMATNLTLDTTYPETKLQLKRIVWSVVSRTVSTHERHPNSAVIVGRDVAWRWEEGGYGHRHFKRVEILRKKLYRWGRNFHSWIMSILHMSRKAPCESTTIGCRQN